MYLYLVLKISAKWFVYLTMYGSLYFIVHTKPIWDYLCVQDGK